MNMRSNSPDPESPDGEELERHGDQLDDAAAEEAPDKTPELPSSLNFPNKFFQG